MEKNHGVAVNMVAEAVVPQAPAGGVAKEVPFELGGIQFAGVQTPDPRLPGKTFWRLKIMETGEIFGPGTGGVSNQSIPKMKADLEELFVRISKSSSADFRRRWNLPPDSPVMAPTTPAAVVEPPGLPEVGRAYRRDDFEVVVTRVEENTIHYEGDAEGFATTDQFLKDFSPMNPPGVEDCDSPAAEAGNAPGCGA